MTPAARRGMAIAGLAGPAYLWLAATVFLPLSAMLYFSFLTVPPIGGREAAFTLRHYAAFFEKEVYWYNAWRSFELGFWVTGTCLLVGYPAAMALARYVRGRWREALFLLVILPFWSNALVRAFSWTMVLRADGIVGRWINAVFPGLWTQDILFTYPAIVIGLVHAYLPYAILTIYISLEGIGEALDEAALSLGATPLQAFRKITLPLSMPGVLAAVFLIFVPVIGSFMEPRILGGTNAIMLGPIIENQFVTAFNWPLGSALSFTMLAIVLLVLAASAPFAGRYMSRGQG